jgi:hypothetical protein
MQMTKKQRNGLVELSLEGAESPFEDPRLGERTNFQSRAPRAGADFKAMAISWLRSAGATIDRTDFEIDGFPVDAEISGSNGRRFLVLARGTPQEQKRGALRRTDTVEKMGFMAVQLARCQDLPILVIASDLPKRSTKAGIYLAALSDDVWDVVALRDDFRGFQRLRAHLHGPMAEAPPPAPWRLGKAEQTPSLFDQPDALDDSDSSAEPGLRNLKKPQA